MWKIQKSFALEGRPLTAQPARGDDLDHICYEVSSLEGAIQHEQKMRHTYLQAHSSVFPGYRLAVSHSRSGSIVELISMTNQVAICYENDT